MAPKKPAPKAKPAAGKSTTAGAAHRSKQGYSVADKGGGGGGSRSRLWLVLGGVAVIAVVAVGAYLVFGRDTASAFSKGLSAANCTDTTYPDMGRGHLAEGEPAPKYNSDPPTSGAHQPVPALWGIYDTPIDQDILVHNLEHGGLVVQYGDQLSQETVSQLQQDVLKDRDFMVLVPYPKLGSDVSFTMWTRLVRCKSYDVRVLDGLRTRRNQPPAPETPLDPKANRQPGF